MIDWTGQYDVDATLWMGAHEKSESTRKDHEFKLAQMARDLSDKYGPQWIAYLSDEGLLTVTRQTVDNKVKWARVVDKTELSTEQAVKIGMKRLLQLDKMNLLTPDWIDRAFVLSGKDWTHVIREHKGVEETSECPACGSKIRVAA